MLTTPFAITIRVRRGGGRTTMGDPKPYTYHDIDGCIRWPLQSSETNDRAATVITGFQLTVPPGADLVATDEVAFPDARGDLPEPDDDAAAWWSVDGKVLPWGPSPFTGWEPGKVATLTEVTG